MDRTGKRRRIWAVAVHLACLAVAIPCAVHIIAPAPSGWSMYPMFSDYPRLADVAFSPAYKWLLPIAGALSLGIEALFWNRPRRMLAIAIICAAVVLLIAGAYFFASKTTVFCGMN